MTKLCSRCDKSVYPTEELKCLDKIWHKTCFRCHECSMTLNMKTYKGFNKLPYCEAHIPKAKATTVTETPEMRRLAENTKLQSQVQYHADFEKAKGKFTQVADDPETLRIKANSKIISNVSYHGDLEKKAAMEQKRNLAGDDPTNGNHNDDSGSADRTSVELVTDVPPQQQQQQHRSHISATNYQQQPRQQTYQQHHQQLHQQQQQQQHRQAVSSPIRGVAPNADSPYSGRQSASSTLVYSSQPNALVNQPQGRRIGSISDYEPSTDGYRTSQQQHQQQQQQHHHHHHQQQPQQQTQQQKLQQYYQEQQRQHALHVQQQQQQQQQQRQQQQQQQQQQALQQLQHQQAMQQQQQHQQHNQYGGSSGISSGYHPSGNQRISARSYRAMYDYDADDDDEVSFRDGDVIVDCKPIDEGWMIGTVLRTGRSGMVPANYIEPIN